jgi:hypothetical protein
MSSKKLRNGQERLAVPVANKQRNKKVLLSDDSDESS